MVLVLMLSRFSVLVLRSRCCTVGLVVVLRSRGCTMGLVAFCSGSRGCFVDLLRFVVV